MSLIEEALRKQKEESERAEKTPAVPPPLPEPDSSATEQTNAATPARPWRLLAGLLFGGIVIVVVILLLFFYGVFLWRQSPEKPGVGSNKRSTTTPPISATVNTVLVERVSTPTNHPSATGDQISATVTQSVITVTTTPPPTNAPPSPAFIQPLSAPEKAIPPVIWPRLMISGIIGGGKTGHSVVIINGKMLSPGDSIENVKVVTIEKQRVKLVYAGEDRVLSAGSSTE